MISRSTILHLRIPFSVYLAPVFCFAAGLYPFAPAWQLLIVFLIVHLLLYPASNGYNSWFDKDQGSIGGLEAPPPVKRELYYVALAMDGAAILLGLWLCGWFFALMLLIYGLVSKAYSHPAVRLKKRPVASLLTAAIFQGAFSFIMIYQAIHQAELKLLLSPQVLMPASLSTLMLLGFYPLTQVYQHEEDRQRGDITFSIIMGIRGTFLFSAVIFMLSAIGYWLYFYFWFTPWFFIAFAGCLGPLLLYYALWMRRVWKDPEEAGFRQVMRMNSLASWCLMVFFLLFALLQYKLFQ
jgi:1,4-dihydroxy-2-naphthoate octaprenyltransferase